MNNKRNNDPNATDLCFIPISYDELNVESNAVYIL